MFKKIKNTIWSRIEKKALAELSENIKRLDNEISATIAKKELELELCDRELIALEKKRSFYDKEFEELKLLHETKSNELRQQIKLLEAKASPDQVWVSAFTAGVSKAWDLMSDTYILSNEETIRNIVKNAENKLMGSVNEIVKKRIEGLDDKQLRDKQSMIEKIKEFEAKKLEAERLGRKDDIGKYMTYLNLLNWVVYDKETV